MRVMIELLIKILVLAAGGFVLKKSGVITDEVQKGLNRLLLKALLPVSIFISSQNVYSWEAVKHMLLVAAISALYYAAAIPAAGLCCRFLKINENAKRIFVCTSVFANIAFLGLPIADELYGAEGVLYGVIYNIFYQFVFLTQGVSIISGKPQLRLKQLLTNPIMAASVLMVAFFLLQIRIPSVLAAPLEAVAAMTVPVSMLLIGCRLVGADIPALLRDQYALGVSALRMIVFPLIMLFVLKLFRVSGETAGICVIMTALPSGTLSVFFADEYHCEAEFASRAVIQTMVWMPVTLTVIILLVRWLL